MIYIAPVQTTPTHSSSLLVLLLLLPGYIIIFIICKFAVEFDLIPKEKYVDVFFRYLCIDSNIWHYFVVEVIQHVKPE